MTARARPRDSSWAAISASLGSARARLAGRPRRLATRGDVELAACDYRGRMRPGATTVAGRATILAGAEAERANRLLRRRYGWQWNIVPLIKVPGVTNVHRDLCVREKLRRARDRRVWADSAIVRVDLP